MPYTESASDVPDNNLLSGIDGSPQQPTPIDKLRSRLTQIQRRTADANQPYTPSRHTADEPYTPPSSSPVKPHWCADDEVEYDVNHILEHTGWGFYQHKVLCVMGFMSFADAAEIWLATIIIKDLVCEWDLNYIEKALIPAVVYFFYAIGSIMSGKMADAFGRYPVMLGNSYVLVLSAICSALAPNYYFFIVARSITGFCIGGNYGTSIVYSSEMVPLNKRAWNMFILEVFWTLGSVYECVIAYFVMDMDEGWRIQILLTALPCVVMLVLMHFMDESPRYLTITNQQDKAMVIVRKMCKQNKTTVPVGRLSCSDERTGEFGEIYAKPYTRGSIFISIQFFCNMFLIFAIIILVPDMMSYNYCYMDALFAVTYTNDEGCVVYTDAEYLFLIIIAVLFLPGFFISSLLAEMIGRKITFIGSVYFSAVFTVLMIWCINGPVTYVAVVGSIIGYSLVNEVLWIYTPEFYPTYMRTTAVGLHNGIGKMGAAAGTFLTEYLDSFSITYSLYCFIVVAVLSCIVVLFFPRETWGEGLQDTRSNERTLLTQDRRDDFEST